MAASSTQMHDARRVDGSIDVKKLAQLLLVTTDDLAATAGISESDLSANAEQPSAAAQVKLSEFLEILEDLVPWTGDARGAFTWYRSESLPSFGNLTAEDLVRAGRTTDLRSYLARVDSGGYT